MYICEMIYNKDSCFKLDCFVPRNDFTHNDIPRNDVTRNGVPCKVVTARYEAVSVCNLYILDNF
jgi:hypothetical protein